MSTEPETNGALPWEMLDAETPPAFAAFAAYRDLGPQRSVERAYERVTGRKLEGRRVNGKWQRWSVDHRWVARARAYDIALDAKARVENEKEAIKHRRQMLQQHAEEARGLRQVARRILAEFERRFNDRGTLQWVGGDDFIKMMALLPKITDTAQKLERLAVGEPEVNLEPPRPIEDMDEAELTSYIALLRETIH